MIIDAHNHPDWHKHDFDAFIKKYIEDCPTHAEYLDRIGASRLLALSVKPGYGYVPGLKRK